MSCSPFDLRDYFLKELSDAERRQVESHAHACPQCREELERLRVTEAALFSLREEEIPQRIAFVSDKIFEPSPWRRWWDSFWGSTARLGFASAALLSIALVVFALARPGAYAPGPPSGGAATLSAADVQHRIDAAVQTAVAQLEARQAQKIEQLARDLDQRDRQQQQLMQAAAVEFDFLTRRDRPLITASTGIRPDEGATK